MNFRARERDRLELNLIPLIDVLIVLLIFLMLTTSFRRESGLSLRLPIASGQPSLGTQSLHVAIDAEGRIEIQGRAIDGKDRAAIRDALAVAATGHAAQVSIQADRATPHQFVITVLSEAGKLGLTRVSFALDPEPEHE